LLGGVGYALLGSSRQLAIGPTSAISLMIADTVAGMADGDAQRYAQIASLAAMMVALFCILAWLLRLSILVRLISDSILVGFKAGAGLTIAMTQLPSLIGVPGGGHNFFERMGLLAGQLGQIQYPVLALGVVAILLLIMGERLLPARPVGLAVVALSIVVASAFGLADLGVPTTGEVPAGLPSLELPGLRLRDVEGIVPLAGGCVYCLLTLKAFRRRARLPASMGIASIHGRNSSALTRRTSWQDSAMVIPLRVACRSRRSTTRQARALPSRSFLPPARSRPASCF
jgi:sulfate permease, SulP family